MRRISIILTAVSLITLLGCGKSTTSPTATASSAPSSPSVTETSPNSTPNASAEMDGSGSSPISEDYRISAEGIGAAKVGMTYGELKKALGANAQLKVESPFIVDFDAIAVSQAGKVQYYILYPAGTTLTDANVIDTLITENPAYRTAEGVGPGTPLKQAESTYGKATLSYNTATEGREYVTFANEPAKNMFFRLGALGDGSLMGVYPSATGEYNETKKYQENALIRSVGVDCAGKQCQNP